MTASTGGRIKAAAWMTTMPPNEAPTRVRWRAPWSRAQATAAAVAWTHAVPALFAVAPGDRYVTVADMRRLYQASSARPKRLVVMPAALGHGWAMLDNNGWTPLALRVAAWTTARYP